MPRIMAFDFKLVIMIFERMDNNVIIKNLVD